VPHSLNDLLPLDDLGATIFFQLVSARYDRGGIILTSNKSYGEWGSTFGDRIIATAILDQLLHHSNTINIRGESYRLKARRKAGLIPYPNRRTRASSLKIGPHDVLTSTAVGSIKARSAAPTRPRLRSLSGQI